MGREIENYIPSKVIARWLKVEEREIQQSEQYDDFFTYLDRVKDGKGKHYRTHKPLLAEAICPHFVKGDMDDVLDLSQRIEELCSKIRQWNNSY